MYFLANDPRVPEVCPRPDLLLESGDGVPESVLADLLYIREARRMVGQYVMTEHDCLARRQTPEPIGMART